MPLVEGGTVHHKLGLLSISIFKKNCPKTAIWELINRLKNEINK